MQNFEVNSWEPVLDLTVTDNIHYEDEVIPLNVGEVFHVINILTTFVGMTIVEENVR